MKRLKIGSVVECRFFNTPDGKFYGDYFNGEVKDIVENYQFSTGAEKGFVISRGDYNHYIVLKRKEIKRILA